MHVRKIPDLQLIILMMTFIILLWLIFNGTPHTAFADVSLSIGGQSQEDKMDGLKNLFTTIQVVQTKWVGITSGFLMLGIGIWRFFSNHHVQGIIAVACAAACFILDKIGASLAQIGGG